MFIGRCATLQLGGLCNVTDKKALVEHEGRSKTYFIQQNAHRKTGEEW